MSWASQAACVGEARLFFSPDRYERDEAKARRIAKAKAICATCPVIERCREEGRREEFGVWAGLTAPERKRWRRLSKQPKGIERVA